VGATLLHGVESVADTAASTRLRVSYGAARSWAFPRSTNPRHSGNQRPQSATAATGFAADTAAATAARRRHACLYGWRSSCIV